MATSLEARIAALEKRVKASNDMLIVRINRFNDQCGVIEEEAHRIITGAGQSWDRTSDETEVEFIARAKREASAVGAAVLVIANKPSMPAD